MVDYSKWDSLEVSDDEDEPARPRVTRLDAGTRITVGADGAVHAEVPPPSTTTAAPAPAQQPHRPDYSTNYSKWDSLEISDEEDGDDGEGAGGEWDEEAGAQGEESQAAQYLATHRRAAGQPASESARRSDSGSPVPGGEGGERAEDRYLWSQEQDEVVVAVAVPADTRAAAVRVDVSERTLRVGLAQGAASTTWLVDGELVHRVVVTGDPTDVDWEVRDLSPSQQAELLEGSSTLAQPQPEQQPAGAADSGPRRAVVLTLRKDMPHGVVLWWKVRLALSSSAMCA
jgi:hypothetical protein